MVRRIISQIEPGSPAGGQLPISDFNQAKDNQINPENLDKITHDIRGSINVIIGYTQLMLDQTTGKINDKQRRALQDILNSSNNLYNLTDIIFKRLDAESRKK